MDALVGVGAFLVIVVLCCVVLDYSTYDVMGWMDIYLDGATSSRDRQKALLGLDAVGWDRAG